MSLCGESDSLLCRTFPVFLRKQALEWFTGLPVNYIDSWSDLSLRFIQQFAHCGPHPKTTHNLCGVRQKPGEKVREYYERFQAEARQVKGLENQTYLLLFTTGLQPGGLADSLAKKRTGYKGRVDGKDSENVIKRLIQEGKLQKYVRRGEGDGCKEDKIRRLDRSRSPPRGRNREANKNQRAENQSSPGRVPVGHICTIAGGRAGGGESGNAQKKT
ncbi:uncharacterized protein LOC133302986 [Gastrolobium bilobum]|uniref:uncharacterized protein LOC133302986 n=1 Tax=Gastrolobium bilobum TaxID=150636 RepID=UPI002AB05872|nr:uncharacterized protein LOC133302986 [Gastrolobium bilobum]